MPRARRPRRPASEGAPFRRLLIPLDGSRLAEAVLPVGTRLADAYGASIVLLHVIEKNAATRVHGERHLTRTEEAEAYLAGVARRLSEGGRQVEWHTHAVPVGDVAESIASHDAEHATDVTILCTHGEGGLRDVLWGSIAQQVLQHSTSPVLLVRAQARERAEPFAPQTMMVPLDGTVAAEAALPAAASLAGALQATLRLVLVVPTIDTVSSDDMAVATFLPGASRLLLDVQEEQANTYLERLGSSMREEGIPTLTEVRRGNAVAQLATDTGEHADGLVVIATHGRAGLQAIWTPSVAARLLRRTQAPILLVPILE